MRKRLLAVVALCFFSWMAIVFAACRSAPPSPQSPAESPEPPTSESALPAEAPPSPGEPPPPPKPAIVRSLPESLISPPEKDAAAPRVDYNTVIHNRSADVRHSFWRYRVTRQGNKLVGFEFSNYGGNRILPPRRDAVKNQFFTRDFQFRFDERARQDVHLAISDWVPSRDRVFRLSELMNSMLLFFPRSYLPAIVNAENRNIVTLPTGEEVEFDAATHEVAAGVFTEAPVDLNPDRAARRFPAVEYRGKGVVVRADARGGDPRLGAVAVITTGAPPAHCPDGAVCGRCEVKSQELWEQSAAARFKFASDTDFERFLLGRCGFGVPKVAAESPAAAASAASK